jgi:NDP-sugar pyrophosphorylase family protein
MLPLHGRPFIDYKLDDLRAGGTDRVVLLTGHGGEPLEDHVGDGSRYGLAVEVVRDPPALLGTGGAIRHALPILGPAFLVTYGDTLLDVPLAGLAAELERADVLMAMSVLENNDRWETSNVDVHDGWVVAYDKPSSPGRHRYLDYGMLAMRAAAFDAVDVGPPFDLADVLRPLIRLGRVRALTVTRRFYDIGNESAIAVTEQFLAESGPIG